MQFNLLLFLTILIIFLIISFTLFYFNQKHNIRIRKSVNVSERKRILHQLYNIIIDASEKTNTKPFLVYGTLLGYIRNKDLICYDYDLDFGIDNKQYELLKSHLMETIKFYPEYKIIDKDYITTKNIEIIHIKTRISADIFSFTTNNSLISRDVPYLYTKFYLKESCPEFPSNWISPLKEVSFLNRNTYIPNISSNLLKCYYGTDFIIPDHDCNSDCTKCTKKI
jgi:phosphorylcholine metabolism protein LicD